MFFDLFDRFLDVNDPTLRNRTGVIAHKLAVMSEWARMLDIHMCLIAQINREPESNKKDHRPHLGHLYGSDAYGQYCDLVMLLYREDMYKDDEVLESDDTVVEVIIEKQRDGMEGKAWFTWEKPILRLTERIYAEGL